jgi:N-methylhydantoinase A
MRVGIEIGGTFTDLICIDQGTISVTKVPSTPRAPQDGFFLALKSAGIAPADIDELVHGSTVATNAVLERKGARVGLITTAGFRDVLWIQRQDKSKSYDLTYKKPEPVVARRDVIEILERVAADGTIVTPMDMAAARAILEREYAANLPEVVAISLLNAYANPAHEVLLADIVNSIAPGIDIVCSHLTSREFREYERTSTTTLSAYVKPVIGRYLSKIGEQLGASGFKGSLSVMQSNGGRLPVAAMQEQPITALFSGPAAGTIGAMRLAESLGYHDIITLDIGGTSADISLITGSKTTLQPGTWIDELPVRTPVLDISTIGAGGGSIIWRDAGGMLRVGPQSSGAEPGPACYGRGGKFPTITDAHVVRGTLQADRFLGGRTKLDIDAARLAFSHFAAELDVSIEELADSAIRVANAHIVRAVQSMSTSMGKDPRAYALLAFGGAGPLHVARVAEELAIKEVIVPANAGVLSAYGLLSSAYLVYETATRRVLVDDNAVAAVRETFEELARVAEARLVRAGIGGPYQHELALLMRYVGQAFEIEVPMTAADLKTLNRSALEHVFQTALFRQFGHNSHSRRAAEIVSFRCGVSSALGHERLTGFQRTKAAPRVVNVTVLEEQRQLNCAVVGWPQPDQEVVGPAIIDASTSTVYVPPNWHARAESTTGTLLMRYEG